MLFELHTFLLTGLSMFLSLSPFVLYQTLSVHSAKEGLPISPVTDYTLVSSIVEFVRCLDTT
jgi:hypothetical protein